MKIKYFRDTDTVLVEFQDRKVFETKEINDDILLDWDEFGNLVALTIEHANIQTGLPSLSYEQIEREFSPETISQTI
jgi:uncharacterized protein YuzE